jgi:hypothetical protein
MLQLRPKRTHTLFKLIANIGFHSSQLKSNDDMNGAASGTCHKESSAASTSWVRSHRVKPLAQTHNDSLAQR